MQGHPQISYSNRGVIVSVVFHLILLAIFFIPFLRYNNELPTSVELEPGGLMVTLGTEDAGQNEESIGGETETVPSTQGSISPSPELASNNDDVDLTVKPTPKPIPAKPVSKPTASTSATNSNIPAPTNAEAAASAEASAKKKQLSNLFDKGKGSGGNNGNQGQANGDPSGSALSGVTSGSGRVGGGLSGRGVLYEPKFTDNSQKTGKVSLQVCVDSKGKVSQADFTQKGSTTSDPYLIKLARETTFKYKFAASEITSQCGTVTIDFKVQ